MFQRKKRKSVFFPDPSLNNHDQLETTNSEPACTQSECTTKNDDGHEDLPTGSSDKYQNVSDLKSCDSLSGASSLDDSFNLGMDDLNENDNTELSDNELLADETDQDAPVTDQSECVGFKKVG